MAPVPCELVSSLQEQAEDPLLFMMEACGQGERGCVRKELGAEAGCIWTGIGEEPRLQC